MAVLDDVKLGNTLKKSEEETINKVDRYVSLSPELSHVASPEVLAQLKARNPQLNGISFDELSFYNNYRLQKATELTTVGTPAKAPTIWSSVSSTFNTGKGKPSSGSLSTSGTRNLKENSIADRWGALLQGQYGEKIAGIKSEGEFLKWRDTLPELEKAKYPRTMWKFKKYYDVSQWRKLVRAHPQLQKLEKYASISLIDASPAAQALRLEAFKELQKIQTEVQNNQSSRNVLSRFLSPSIAIPDNALEYLSSIDKTIPIVVKPGSLPLESLSPKDTVVWRDGQQQLSQKAQNMLGKSSIILQNGAQVLTPEMETFKKKRVGKEQRLAQAKQLRQQRRPITNARRKENMGIARVKQTHVDPLLKKTAIRYTGGYAIKRARELYLKQKQERIIELAKRTEANQQARILAEQERAQLEQENSSNDSSAYESILNNAESKSQESAQPSPSSSSSGSGSNPLSQRTNNWMNNKIQNRLGNAAQNGANKLAGSNNKLLSNLGSRLGGLGGGTGAAAGAGASATTGTVAGGAIATSEIWVPVAIVVAIIIFIIILIVILIAVIFPASNNPLPILLNKTVDKTAIANPVGDETEPLTYTLTASYPATASSIFITDLIPDNTEFVSAEGNFTAYDASGNKVSDIEKNKADIRKVVWNVLSASSSASSSDKPLGWPTNGLLTQGPLGPFDHADVYRKTNGAESVDIASGDSPPIYSTFTGNVKIADMTCGTCETSYGNYVVLTDEKESFEVFYGHFSSIKVKAGDKVKRGDVLGIMGNTGFSTGIHTHYEFRKLRMIPPYVPQAITPSDCDSLATPCTPASVAFDLNLSAPEAGSDYWFLLHRKSKREELYKGVYGDKSKSTVVKSSSINPGITGKSPTPLPSLASTGHRDSSNNLFYWNIERIQENSGEALNKMGKYFFVLDVPYETDKNGPVPYNECNGQCFWPEPGQFGLHGVGDTANRISDAGSSGCVRHTNKDIEDLYSRLKDVKNTVRYYMIDD